MQRACLPIGLTPLLALVGCVTESHAPAPLVLPQPQRTLADYAPTTGEVAVQVHTHAQVEALEREARVGGYVVTELAFAAADLKVVRVRCPVGDTHVEVRDDALLAVVDGFRFQLVDGLPGTPSTFEGLAESVHGSGEPLHYRSSVSEPDDSGCFEVTVTVDFDPSSDALIATQRVDRRRLCPGQPWTERTVTTRFDAGSRVVAYR